MTGHWCGGKQLGGGTGKGGKGEMVWMGREVRGVVRGKAARGRHGNGR